MGKQAQGVRTKHTPIRTCIGCRQAQGKRTLIRLVRTPDGVVVDPTGKLAGRGAYVHSERVCWEAALKGGRLEQALRVKLSAENRTAIAASLERLAVGSGSDA
jgi:uncharacterized protein